MLAVLGVGHPFDVFHDQVGDAVFGHPAVQQAGDVGVVEVGQDLALLAKAGDDGVGVHPAFNQLDGHPLLILIVVPMGGVDHRHAPTSHFAHHPIGTESAALYGLRG